MPRDPSVNPETDAEESGWRELPPRFMPPTAPRRLSPLWLLARLRTMSAGEIGSRAWRTLRLSLRPPAPPSIRDDRRWLPEPLPLSEPVRHAVVDDANSILAGSYPLLGRWVYAGARPEWAHAFGHLAATGTTGELSPAEDVRYLLELNRHGHFVCLAQAWHVTRDRRLVERIADHVLDWTTSCPPGRGAAWSSPIEAAMRLIQWSVAWQWIDAGRNDGPIAASVRDRWLASVAAHVDHVAARLSSHSSGNNHLIAELVGLLLAAATWPDAIDRADVAHIVARLEQELLAQHTHDGVNREQAIAYQIFVFDLFVAARAAAAGTGLQLHGEVDRRMAQSARFVAAMRSARGALPPLGDSDDADAIRWSHATLATRASRMTTLAAAIGIAPELAALADPTEPALFWLALRVPVPKGNAAEVRRSLPRRFVDGGHCLLGSEFGTSREVLVRFDCGPLGYLRIAAHGHADALALTLAIGGHEVLVDRGTFTYNARPQLRNAFRGTLMHNTITVDGFDQSTPAGPFIWLQHARAEVEACEGTDVAAEAVGCHDGYARLCDPVSHRRRVRWDGAAARLTVDDWLDTAGRHEIAVAWHFDSDCALRATGRTLEVDTLSADVHVASHAEDARGRPIETLGWLLPATTADQAVGWHAASFGHRRAAHTALFCGPIQGSARIVTVFEIRWHGGPA